MSASVDKFVSIQEDAKYSATFLFYYLTCVFFYSLAAIFT